MAGHEGGRCARQDHPKYADDAAKAKVGDMALYTNVVAKMVAANDLDGVDIKMAD